MWIAGIQKKLSETAIWSGLKYKRHKRSVWKFADNKITFQVSNIKFNLIQKNTTKIFHGIHQFIKN